MLVEKDLPIGLDIVVDAAWQIMKKLIIKGHQPSQAPHGSHAIGSVGFDLAAETPALLTDFIFDRLAGSLREQGYSPQEVDAVLTLRPQRLGDVPKRLAAVRAFAALPEAPALAAANKRIGNILKKTDDVDAHVSPVLLQEPAEIALNFAMQTVLPQALSQWEAGDYTGSLQSLAALRVPVDAFFEDVMVNVEALDLRLNRLGLLKCLHVAMNRVADLSKLA
jgi:glycyl-tRNA synthetase beta chain